MNAFFLTIALLFSLPVLAEVTTEPSTTVEDSITVPYEQSESRSPIAGDCDSNPKLCEGQDRTVVELTLEDRAIRGQNRLNACKRKRTYDERTRCESLLRHQLRLEAK